MSKKSINATQSRTSKTHVYIYIRECSNFIDGYHILEINAIYFSCELRVAIQLINGIQNKNGNQCPTQPNSAHATVIQILGLSLGFLMAMKMTYLSLIYQKDVNSKGKIHTRFAIDFCVPIIALRVSTAKYPSTALVSSSCVQLVSFSLFHHS